MGYALCNKPILLLANPPSQRAALVLPLSDAIERSPVGRRASAPMPWADRGKATPIPWAEAPHARRFGISGELPLGASRLLTLLDEVAIRVPLAPPTQ